MEQAILVAFLNNAALLLVLSVIYEITYYLPPKHSRMKPVYGGLMISMICIAIMMMPLTFLPGVIYDTRSILISVTALIFGPIPTAIIAAVAIILRLIIGGAGTLPGIAVIMCSALIGLAWRRWVHEKSGKWRWLSVFFMSITVHIVMLACMFLLPYPDSMNVIRVIALPVMLVYPLVSIPLSLLLYHQQEYQIIRDELKGSEERFRSMFDKVPLGYQSLDIDGNFIDINQQWMDTLGYSRDEVVGKWFGDFLSPDEIETFRRMFPIFTLQGHIHSEFVMLHKNGNQVFVSFEGKIGYGKDGKFCQTHCILHDITAARKANQNYQQLFSEMIDAFALHEIICDDQGKPVDYRFLTVNPAFEHMTGLKSADILGKTVMEVLPDTEPYWIEKFGRVALTGEPVRFGDYAISSDKHYEVCAYQPSPNQFACTFSDVTQRVQAEKENEEKYSSYIENAPYGIFIANDKGQFIEVNSFATALTGYGREQLVKMSIVDIAAEESPESAMRHLEKLINTGYLSIELKYAHRNGSIRWLSVDSVKLSEHRYLAFASDITEKKDAEENLQYLSNHDFLTGLYNRRFYEAELQRLDIPSQLPLTIMMGDINGVKLVNDAFGHTEGDRLIVDSAKILSSCCRKGDILARIGGDEFGILMPKTDNAAAMDILSNIYAALNTFDANVPQDKFMHSVSLGFATKAAIDEDVSQICRIADQYIYERKLLEHNSSHSAIISSIKATMSENSHETAEHAQRLAILSKGIAMGLNLSQTDRDRLELLATLHDIGKVGISEHVLTKRGKLSEDEWIEMKRHPEIGYRIAISTPDLLPIAESILYHHEWWDGRGYPQGLSGENIPLLSRILSIVDAYDAMTQDRPYRQAMSHEEAITEIGKCAGTQFDPQIAQIMIKNLH